MMKRCSGCSGPLGKQYLKLEGVFFHVNCLRCQVCRQNVSGEYLNKKGLIYHPKCYRQKSGLRCDHCGHILDKTWKQRDKHNYHPECYQAHVQEQCLVCQKLIEGSYTRDENGAYHLACFERERLEPCDACAQPLKGKYLVDIWGNKAHAQHGGIATLQCHVCARLISEQTSQGGVQYHDGRIVCGLCRMSEITDASEIEQSKTAVLELLSRVGLEIPNYISVSLADKGLLNQRLGVSLRANSHGYTKTLERHINQDNMIMEHSVFILFGLPRLMFHAVLAHELIHVWLNERRLHHWSKKEIEGFCNLGSALIYQEDGTPLANVLLNRLDSDSDPVYGDGYRLMLKRLQKKGWATLIGEMQQRTPLQNLNKFIDRFI